MSDVEVSPSRMPFMTRWWTYQKERFPLLGHGILIAAFSFCAVSLSRMLRGDRTLPPARMAFVAFATAFTFFLQLRIADEFKDIEEDTRYRPYRPVPRGLVTLRELAWLFVIGCAVQLGLALGFDARLFVLLAITWAYLALMSKEFFVADWLRKRPVLYMTSHMLIMPLVDLYATGTDWLPSMGRPPSGLWLFLVTSYLNGMVIEVGRKIRSPEDEEVGVDTYTRLWGRGTAVILWWALAAATLVSALAVAQRLRAVTAVCIVIGGCFTVLIIVGSIFLSRPAPRRGKWIETASGIWTIVLYLGLGLLPRWLAR